MATPEWQREIERTGGVPHFMKSRELGAYLESQYGVFRSVLSELGLAK